MDEEFKPGDLVYLKSGSPKMVILKAYHEVQTALVLWLPYGTSEIKQDNVPYIALRKHTT